MGKKTTEKALGWQGGSTFTAYCASKEPLSCEKFGRVLLLEEPLVLDDIDLRSTRSWSFLTVVFSGPYPRRPAILFSHVPLGQREHRESLDLIRSAGYSYGSNLPSSFCETTPNPSHQPFCTNHATPRISFINLIHDPGSPSSLVTSSQSPLWPFLPVLGHSLFLSFSKIVFLDLLGVSSPSLSPTSWKKSTLGLIFGSVRYQTTLSDESTDRLIKSIDPELVFSGDAHFFTYYSHNWKTKEVHFLSSHPSSTWWMVFKPFCFLRWGWPFVLLLAPWPHQPPLVLPPHPLSKRVVSLFFFVRFIN